MSELDEVVVRESADRQDADRWLLVLEAKAIPCRVAADGGAYRLLAKPALAAAAREELEAFEAEALQVRPLPPRLPPSQVGALLGAFLLAFHALVLWTNPGAWLSVGAASAERIWAGEWWRAVTALTLHADLEHVLGNAVAAFVLVNAVGSRLGPGAALAVVFASGVLGNLLTAAYYRTGHLSVGASTSLFGAIGVLSSLRLRADEGPVPPLHVFGAALALLAMLGVGERADVAAHTTGLISGLALGFAIPKRRRGFAVQAIWLAAPLIVLTWAWTRGWTSALSFAP